tara:strand:- start:580 stop:1161 length:582 start_codon:yes stop_codon:yes gene_type:complete
MLLCEGELNNPIYKLYTQKYDLKKLKNDKVSSKPNIKNILCETTENDGVIVMRYNEDREGFEYWADKKQINFDVLNTVCRKYCITFKNIDLYIDRNDEYEKQINEFKKKKEEEKEKEKEEEKEEKEDSIFATGKKEKKNMKFKPEWKDNKFINCGFVKDSPLHKKDEKKDEKKENVKKFSFDEFKKMMKSKLS